MSFPPRQPLLPGIMPYGYAPMGMMPMGMMPGMMRPMNHMRHQQTMIIPPRLNNPPTEQINYRTIFYQKEEKPPATTVFVGNISDKAPDQMIRQLLQRFGTVLNWKRVQGASGKLQAFGFCEFEDPESTLRCMRLLNEWQIADKKLLVKVDAKTKALLDEHKQKKQSRLEEARKKEIEHEDGEMPSDAEQVNFDLDEIEKKQDIAVRISLEAIGKEYEGEIAKLSFENPLNSTDDPQKKLEIMNDIKLSQVAITHAALKSMDVDNDKKDMISREIRTFREHASEESEKAKEEERLERERRRRDEDRRERDHLREREREERERERERERDKERRERDQRIEDAKSRSKTRERSRDREDGEDDETYERKKLERKLREKEAAYQELLRKWESRERKKSREYEKEKDKEIERQLEESKEAKRLREFLEDYDDEKDDVKYYKSTALERRLQEREKELEADEKDRLKEKEELEKIRKKLIEEGHPDIEAEMARIEREREEHLMPRIPGVINLSPGSRSPDNNNDLIGYNSDGDDDCTMIDPPPQESNQINPPFHSHDKSPDSSPVAMLNADSEDEQPQPQPQFKPAFSEDSTSQPSHEESNKITVEVSSFGKFGKGDFNNMSAQSNDSNQKRKKPTVSEVFGMEDEDDDSATQKKRRLVPLEYSASETAIVGKDTVVAAMAAANALSGGVQRGILPSTKPTTAEEKRRCIKNLIECIPTSKEQLFEYKLDWSMVDSNLMERRVKPWVNKKIVEYIGEEEPMLSDFICKKVIANSTPASILSDITTVLDDEAEVFVVKMWRLLIYETEAKKLGLVK